MVVFSQKSQQRIVRDNVESGELYPRFLQKIVRCQVKESFLKLRLSFCQSRCLLLGGYFEIVSGFYQFHWLPNREEFLQTLYNSRIFVLLDEVMKYFFDFVAVFSHSRCLPIEGAIWKAVI